MLILKLRPCREYHEIEIDGAKYTYAVTEYMNMMQTPQGTIYSTRRTSVTVYSPDVDSNRQILDRIFAELNRDDAAVVLS